MTTNKGDSEQGAKNLVANVKLGTGMVVHCHSAYLLSSLLCYTHPSGKESIEKSLAIRSKLLV